MAIKGGVGQVTGLFSNAVDGDWIQVSGVTNWIKCQATNGAMMTVAADARRAGTAVVVIYDDASWALFEIKST